MTSSSRTSLRLWLVLVWASLFLTACGGAQSAVSSAGVQAERLESLWWLFFYITLAVYLIVMGVLIVSFVRRTSADQQVPPETQPDEVRDARAGAVIKGAVAVTVVILFVLMIVSFRTGKAIDRMSVETPELAIKVTGHQWWWEVTYEDEHTPGNSLTTANEIHVPVGHPVKLMLQSNDVIHSLWMPNLHGKKDLIPIYPTTFYFQADRPGTYWGQCAEFCGYQHAKMRFQVVAESDADFQKWVAAGRQVPGPPMQSQLARGREIFTTSVCAQCHTIQGTGAGGRVGPDLTHIGSRPYIAAGWLENNEANLKSWITDPQAIKPGIKMPMNQYSDEELTSLVAYLQSLK